MMVFTIVGRISGACSFVGSSLIIYMIMSDRENKLARPYHRIMLMISVFDVLQSLALTISVTALPRQSGLTGAKGSDLTCKIQGFLLILGFAVPLYNSFLNIYYVLKIRYNISSQAFAKYEYTGHAICILGPLSMGILATVSDVILPRQRVCLPRGEGTRIVTKFFFGCTFLVCIGSMTCICWTVISQAKRTRKYTATGIRNKFTFVKGGKQRRSPIVGDSRIDNDKKKTVVQALSYLFAFLLIYTPLFLALNENPSKISMLLASIFYPLQGFWNFFFYIRPGVVRARELNPEKSYLEAIRDVVLRSEQMQVTRTQPPDNVSPGNTSLAIASSAEPET